MKNFLKSNYLIWSYLIGVFIIELTGVAVTSSCFYMKSPWIFLLLQLFICTILFCIQSNRARHIVCSILLIAFGVIDLIFIVIYEMTETVFDYGMLNLRNDGMAILESVPINFTYFVVVALLIAVYIVIGKRYIKKVGEPKRVPFYKFSLPILMVVFLGLNCLTVYLQNKDFQASVMDKLYRTSSTSYNQYGIVGNFINEMVKGSFFTDVKLGDEEELQNYLYGDASYLDKDGNSVLYNSNFPTNKAKEYNVVTILVESLEWYSFMDNFELYCNGYADFDLDGKGTFSREEVLRQLYPNLYEFYDNSIVFNNFYAREKTDISENLAILGSYPTNAYINYDFPYNTISSSMPNVLKTLDEDILCNSYHNGSYTYYNRNKEHLALGFNKYTASDQMYEKGMVNYQKGGERNLDRDMIETCEEDMFPLDQRFYTFITSITMHGQYMYRKNLASRECVDASGNKFDGYYDALAYYGVKLQDGNSEKIEKQNTFIYYCACVMEFDRALGEVVRYLKDNGLLDSTIITIFGDHNTYYQSLSNYVKGIKNEDNKNYTNLYRIPCMTRYPNMNEIFDFVRTNMADKLTNGTYIINETINGDQLLVNKFSCTADIVPTIMDLLGINNFGNLYFGHSLFSRNQSVLYSRAYDMFITDNMYFSSLSKIKYIRKVNDVNDPARKYTVYQEYLDQADYIDEVEDIASALLKKLDSCNRIFYNDYFARKNYQETTKTNAEIFKEKLREIN